MEQQQHKTQHTNVDLIEDTECIYQAPSPGLSYIKAEMLLLFWWNFCHWLQQKSSQNYNFRKFHHDETNSS